jgi:sepiapterin reductase
VISGRDAPGLQQTTQLIRDLRSSKTSAATEVRMCLSDLGSLESLVDASNELFQNNLGDYSKAIFVNNAGSIFPVAPVGSATSAVENLNGISSAMNINVTAANFLTSEVVRRHLSLAQDASYSTKLVIINLSSLAALVPFLDLANYCTGKAARDMYHRCLVEDLKTKPNSCNVRVLNWAPGPMDTQMVNDVVSAQGTTASGIFTDMVSTGKLVAMEDSAGKLVKLILWEAYESGSHVDYFDPYPEGVDFEKPTTCCACSQCTCGVDCACKTAQKRLCSGCEDALTK